MKKVQENIKRKESRDEQMDVYMDWLQQKKAAELDKIEQKPKMSKEDLFDGILGNKKKNDEKQKKVDPLEAEMEKRR